jgi:hypothetical protein
MPDDDSTNRHPAFFVLSADSFWVMDASRVLALQRMRSNCQVFRPSRVRGLFQDCFSETPQPARETRALRDICLPSIARLIHKIGT